MIPTEQNSKKDQEICEYPIKLSFLQQFDMHIVKDVT